MSSIAVHLGTASSEELVAAAAAIATELAARPAPESAATCMELAESVTHLIDANEAALATLIRRLDGSGELQRWGFPPPGCGCAPAPECAKAGHASASPWPASSHA